MPLNLITDPWIPAIREGVRTTLRPDQIAEEGVSRLDWPRDDLNLACLELLVGLLFLSDPPRHDGDWDERYGTPDSDRLRAALKPFAPHFELTGDGPRFLQDLERLEESVKPENGNPPDMLFIDSAGTNAAKKNADLMVKRGRYPALSLPIAAMALYALQAFAPAGGSGNRTSMRGGGPMVTLVQPLDGGMHALWRLVWSNVPEGAPLPADRAEEALPWLRPTRTSEGTQVVTPDMSHPAEAFFGMPRRLRLLFKEDSMIGVVQKRYGTKYALWRHPLSPYYRQKPGAELLPVHPKPGKVSYRNWLGLAFGHESDTFTAAASVRRFHHISDVPNFEIRMGGWSMDNMKPTDFTLHAYPSFRLDETMGLRVGTLVEAANVAAGALTKALKGAVAMQGRALDAVRETFFANTEAGFVAATQSISNARGQEIEEDWLGTLRRVALALFDQYAVPALPDRSLSGIEAVVTARHQLLANFAKATGIRNKLDLPNRKKEITA